MCTVAPFPVYWIQVLYLTKRFSIWTFINWLGYDLLCPKGNFQQTNSKFHTWMWPYLGKVGVEARTVLHGHGWNNKLDYSTRYCDCNHKITFLDFMKTAFRLLNKKHFNHFPSKAGAIVLNFKIKKGWQAVYSKQRFSLACGPPCIHHQEASYLALVVQVGHSNS